MELRSAAVAVAAATGPNYRGNKGRPKLSMVKSTVNKSFAILVVCYLKGNAQT